MVVTPYDSQPKIISAIQVYYEWSKLGTLSVYTEVQHSHNKDGTCSSYLTFPLMLVSL